MPPITPTERRAQLRRDYALQIDMLRKQAHDGCCQAINIRLENAGDDCVVRFSLFHRDDDNARQRIKRMGATFGEAFKKAYAALPAAIQDVCEDAAFNAECRGDEDTSAQDYEDAKADYYEGRADDAWLEARAAS
jgi:hypothetical protein